MIRYICLLFDAADVIHRVEVIPAETAEEAQSRARRLIAGMTVVAGYELWFDGEKIAEGTRAGAEGCSSESKSRLTRD